MYTNELLLERGIRYDHSLMHNDFTPYYVRVGDSWTKIDYSRKPSEWMVPLKRGKETDLIEIPASWYLDDLPPMMFIKKSPNSHGFVNPHHIEQMWRDQFDWVYREMDYAVFPITIHPDVAGRPQVLMMLERLYAHMIKHPGVKFVTMNEIADDFAARFRGANRPLGFQPAVLSEGGGRHVFTVRCARQQRALDRLRQPVRASSRAVVQLPTGGANAQSGCGRPMRCLQVSALSCPIGRVPPSSCPRRRAGPRLWRISDIFWPAAERLVGRAWIRSMPRSSQGWRRGGGLRPTASYRSVF